MRRALSAVALTIGIAASVATSSAGPDPSHAVTAEGIVLNPESPYLELVLTIESGGTVAPSDVGYVEILPQLENTTHESVRIELYELMGPFEGEGVPEDALYLSTTRIRGAFGDEPGQAAGLLTGPINYPVEEIHLLLHLVDEGDISGDLRIWVLGKDPGSTSKASFTVEVWP